jgi:hypothetical protein
MSKEFIPMDTFDKAIRGWWLLVLFILLGAAAGYILHRLQPEQYLARATISSVIDFNRTGALNDLQQDQMVAIAEDLMTSPETFAAAAEKARQQGINIDGPEFRRIALVDRSYSEWVLRVLYSDPQKAAQLADIWAEVSYQSLVEAYGHAVRGEGLLRYLDSLESCLKQSVTVEPVMANCNPNSTESIQAELEKAGKLAQEERVASHGISTALVFSQWKSAEIPAKPAQFGKNNMILGGMIIGFLLGSIGISAGLAERLRRRLHIG